MNNTAYLENDDKKKDALSIYLLNRSLLFWDMKNMLLGWIAKMCGVSGGSASSSRGSPSGPVASNHTLLCCCFMGHDVGEGVVIILGVIVLIIVAAVVLYIGGLLVLLAACACALLASQLLHALAGLLDNNVRLYGVTSVVRLLIMCFCGYELFRHAMFPAMRYLLHAGLHGVFSMSPAVLNGLAFSSGLALSGAIVCVVMWLFMHYVFPSLLHSMARSEDQIIQWIAPEGCQPLSQQQAKFEQTKSHGFNLLALSIGACAGYGVYTLLHALTWWVASSVCPAPFISAIMVAIVVTFVVKVVMLRVMEKPQVRGLFEEMHRDVFYGKSILKLSQKVQERLDDDYHLSPPCNPSSSWKRPPPYNPSSQLPQQGTYSDEISSGVTPGANKPR